MSLSNNQMVDLYFGYMPDEKLTITAICFFAILTVWSMRAFHVSPHPLTIAIFLTAATELVGFIYRLICSWEANLGNYLATTLPILMAPNLLALYNYVIVGRIIDVQDKCQSAEERRIHVEQYRNPPNSWRFFLPLIQDRQTGLFNANRIGYFFFFADFLSFGLQGMAGGMMAQAASAQSGTRIYQFSLSLQLVFFGAFAWVTYKASTLKYYRSSPGISEESQKTLYHVLFCTIALLTIRNVYRLIEFSEGRRGYIQLHEGFFYAFDTTLIIICLVLYCYYNITGLATLPGSSQRGYNKMTPLASLEEGTDKKAGMKDSEQEWSNL